MSDARGHRRTAVLSRLSLELRRSRRAAAVVAAGVLLAVLAVATLIAQSNLRLPGQDRYVVHVAVEDAKGVVPGRNEVRWAGVVVGRITGAELRGDRPVLRAELDPSMVDGELYRDARLELRPQTALSDMYLDVIDRGDPRAGELDEREAIEPDRTTTPVDIAEVLNVFSDDVADRLRATLEELGRGLPDGGEQLRSSFVAIVPFLERGARLGEVLGERRRLVAGLVGDLRLVMDELARREGEIERLVGAGARSFGAIATERRALGELIGELAPTMSQMTSSFERLDVTLAELRPALAELRPVARELPEGLAALESFSRAATPALRASRPALSALRPLARSLNPAANRLDRGFSQLAPQAPRLDRITRGLAACEQPVAKFFAYTLSTGKLINEENRSASPRGLMTTSSASGPSLAPNPQVIRTPGCADGIGAGR